jgi:DNA-directed RNA polymerase specialized sigma24 family protein
MSVELGGGSTGDHLAAEALRNAGHHVFAHLYENYAARLFDYCVGILRDEMAAAIAVEDTLVAVDQQISELPDPGQLRVLLYSAARRDCLSRLPRHGVAPFGNETSAHDGFAAEQADPDVAAEGDDAPVVAAALARLTDRDQEVLNLAYRHGIVSADLAAVMNVSPRRARAMLSDAGARFQKAAAAVAGNPDRVFRPGMLAVLPIAQPPLTLRLRISLALGSYRRGGAEPASASGDRVVRARHRAPRRMVVPALGLVMLGALGAVVYKFGFTSPASAVAGIASGVQGPVPTSSAQLLPGRDPQGSVRQQKLGPFPGFSGPSPLGVLPGPSPSQSGPPPSPGGPPPSTPPGTKPPTTPPPTTPPTTPPPTTPPPTTPPPTTPPPTTPPPTTPPPTTPPPTTPPPTTPPPTTPPPTTPGPTPTA